jgi:CHAD domain-containing protein
MEPDRPTEPTDHPTEAALSPATSDPEAGPLTLGDAARSAIKKHFAKACGREAAVLADKDPEDLHQMRVALRRLRSAAQGFAVAIDLPKRASDRAVGQVAQILGNLRDLDVMDEALRDRYSPNLPDVEQPLLQSVRDELLAQRKKALNQVTKTLKRREWPPLKQALSTWLDRPKLRPAANWPAAIVVPDLLLPPVCHWLMHPGWLVRCEDRAIGDLSLLEWAVMHDLRKMAKRVRYQMALFTEFYGSDYERSLADIGNVQTVLGDLQDMTVLETFLARVLGLHWANEAPVWARLLERQRDRTWHDWQRLQQQFDELSERERLRHIINRPRRD